MEWKPIMNKHTLMEIGLTARSTSQGIRPRLLILNWAVAWCPTRMLLKINLFSSVTKTPSQPAPFSTWLRQLLLHIWCSSNIELTSSVTKPEKKTGKSAERSHSLIQVHGQEKPHYTWTKLWSIATKDIWKPLIYTPRHLSKLLFYEKKVDNNTSILKFIS